MRREHERQLGFLSVLGIKNLPITEWREEEIAVHQLFFMKLHFILKPLRGSGIKGCKPKTLVNFFVRSGMSPTDGSRRKTIVFSNKSAIDEEARRRDQAQLRLLARGGADGAVETP